MSFTKHKKTQAAYRLAVLSKAEEETAIQNVQAENLAIFGQHRLHHMYIHPGPIES